MRRLLVAALSLILIISFTSCDEIKINNLNDSAKSVELDNPAESTNVNQSGSTTKVSEIKGEVIYSKVTSWKDSIGSTYISYISEYKNTGTEPLYLSSSDVDIEDKNGNLVTIMRYVSAYPEVILPGESAFFYDTTILCEALPAGKLTAVEHIEIEKRRVEKTLFPVTEIKVKDDELLGGIYVTGRVENNTNEEQDLVYISAIIRDKDGNPLCVLWTLEDILAGDKKGFEATEFCIPDNITTAMVGEVTVTAYSIQYKFY